MGLLQDVYVKTDTKPVGDAITKAMSERNKLEKERYISENEMEKEKIKSKDRVDMSLDEYRKLIEENFNLKRNLEEYKIKTEKEIEYYKNKGCYEEFIRKICMRLDGIFSEYFVKNSEILFIKKENEIIDIKLRYKDWR